MKNYIGVKMIGAEPMTIGNYNNYKGWTIPKNENPNREGYLVKYSDDYISWSPKEVFEESYYPIEDITKITFTDVNNFLIPGVGIKMGEKTTVLRDTTLTGFDMIASSPCVDPNNYNQEIGDEYARKKIIDILWGHLGFVLQWARNGLTK